MLTKENTRDLKVQKDLLQNIYSFITCSDLSREDILREINQYIQFLEKIISDFES